MYILSAQQLKVWDQYTIIHEPIASLQLMERAAQKCTDWIIEKKWQEFSFSIFCGKGNNGGDGLAIARLLLLNQYTVSIYILETGSKGSEDFQANLQRLHELPLADIHYLQSAEHFPVLSKNQILVDALFGYGLNKSLSGLAADLVNHLNQSGSVIVSIDLPSGLYVDRSSKGNPVIRANYTLSFECYKLALLVQENAEYIGEVHILPIGLHAGYFNEKDISTQLITKEDIRQLYRARNPFAHKGEFGHSLLIAGSYGKMGAAVLAARACLHSGTGLLTCYLPKCGYVVMQTAVPEAMVLTDENENMLTQLPDEIEKYDAIGIGPGIGTSEPTQRLISFMVRRYQKPLVIDADGLNCISMHPELLKQLPPFSIITPHPKEFDRLTHHHENDFERIEAAREMARSHKIIVVLKGHHTLVAMPGGSAWFNSTGNAGMAKGGSGDVLTGIITSFVAQRYEPVAAALLGVYLHGCAGDAAAVSLGETFILPSELIGYLPAAFSSLETTGT